MSRARAARVRATVAEPPASSRRRRQLAAATFVAATALLLLHGPAAWAARSASPAALTETSARPTPLDPTRVQVVAMEFYYILSRHTVAAGPAIVQLVDFGQDPHDLRMQRVGGTRVYGTPIIQPGALYDLRLNLLPGTYQLWCSVANHRALGMEARLVVTADPPAGPAPATG